MKTLDELTKITHFSRSEVDMLVKMYLHYTDKKLDRIKFRDILLYLFGMTNDILMDRVFKAFDKDNDSWINQEEWICGLSVFLRGTDEEKIQYCFEVYDLNGDGYISREEMFQMLKNCLIKQPTEEDPDEGIKDLVDLVLKKMDLDHDARLSFSDYKSSVFMDPLLIEAFGPCLPTDELSNQFLDVEMKSVKEGTTVFFNPSTFQPLLRSSSRQKEHFMTMQMCKNIPGHQCDAV